MSDFLKISNITNSEFKVRLSSYQSKLCEELHVRSLQQFDYIELADLLGVGIPRQDARRLLDAVKEAFHVSCLVEMLLDIMQTVCLNLGQSSFFHSIHDLFFYPQKKTQEIQVFKF